MNIMNAIKNMIGFNSPKEMVLKMLGQNSNPMINNLIQMAEKGDSKGIENFARNIFKDKGMDFDKEFSNFMNTMK